MEVDLSTKPTEVFPLRTWMWQSKSREGMFHYTFLLEDDTIACSCEGFTYAEHCRHVTWVATRLVEEEKYPNGILEEAD